MAQVDDPFSVRFSLHNPSNIFLMTDMRFNCVLVQVKLDEYFSLVGIPVDDGKTVNIPPNKTVEYICPIEKVLDLGTVFQATIRIDVKYKTLGYERTTKSELFSWDNVSRQWIRGEIVN